MHQTVVHDADSTIHRRHRKHVVRHVSIWIFPYRVPAWKEKRSRPYVAFRVPNCLSKSVLDSGNLIISLYFKLRRRRNMLQNRPIFISCLTSAQTVYSSVFDRQILHSAGCSEQCRYTDRLSRLWAIVIHGTADGEARSSVKASSSRLLVFKCRSPWRISIIA